MNAFNDSSCKFDKSCIYKLMYISADRKKKQTTKYFDQVICVIIEKRSKRFFEDITFNMLS